MALQIGRAAGRVVTCWSRQVYVLAATVLEDGRGGDFSSRRERGPWIYPGSAGPSPRAAGPLSKSPSGAKREPWQGQSQEPSAGFQRTRQPRWGQTALRSVSS